MLNQKILRLFLLLSFLGALCLTTLPSLHQRQAHHLTGKCHHHSHDDCKICNLLDHFNFEPQTLKSPITLPEHLYVYQKTYYQQPILSLPSALIIPRAPPMLF